MYTNHFISKSLLGASLFVSLMPLSFYFESSAIHLIIDSPYNQFLLIAQGIIIIAILMARSTLHQKAHLALALLFALVPFTFVFSSKGISFIVLNHVAIAVFSWLIALILIYQLIFNSKSKVSSVKS